MQEIHIKEYSVVCTKKTNLQKQKNLKRIRKSREQNVALKQKAQLDATKQAQRSRSAQDKMVNPETGEPLLQIGIAYKHLKKKQEQEKQEKEQKEAFKEN